MRLARHPISRSRDGLVSSMPMEAEIKTYYDNYYQEVNFEGVGGAATRFTEAALERRFTSKDHFARVLELGAGHGEHFPYVRHRFDEYILSDLTPHACDIEQLMESRRERLPDGASDSGLVTFQIANAEDLQFDDDSFDRTVNTCLLHHLRDPDRALKEWRRVVKPGGVVSIYLNNDPGALLRLTRQFTTHRRSRKVAAAHEDMLPTKYLWAREHRNHVLGLKQLIKYNFRTDKIRQWNFPFGRASSWNLNYFTIMHITIGE